MSNETSTAEIYVPTRPTWDIEVGKRYTHTRFTAESALVKGFNGFGRVYFDKYIDDRLVEVDDSLFLDNFRRQFPRLSDAPVPVEKRLAQAVETMRNLLSAHGCNLLKIGKSCYHCERHINDADEFLAAFDEQP